jgi:hypothetical protein
MAVSPSIFTKVGKQKPTGFGDSFSSKPACRKTSVFKGAPKCGEASFPIFERVNFPQLSGFGFASELNLNGAVQLEINLIPRWGDD